ncbi:LOW QUALITY PROTEIN: hypothetical protein PHMEG_00015510 [Phytophthora megakarya]|uniref:Reverse transcriptase RNase H-like domain-containing protein n=1 Tax=Phytophthora megakarya TaxID=4795 RepID=A0A225W1K9_9STRA|nr:LOW QUALITY PROTEIN: hypothetical protein PHMEG_00015510 [Phytophthora megakarya]
MKTAMMQAVGLLTFSEYCKPFPMHTDASGYQHGAVIPKFGRPLACWSKKCNDAQKKYYTNKIELLSIKLVFQEYRTMLLGHEVHTHIDHLDLTYGMYNNVHMLRWRLQIEPDIRYVKGEDNVVAYTISRLPRADDRSLQYQNELVVAAARDLTTLSNGDLREIAHSQKLDDTEILRCATTKEVNGVERQVDGTTGRIIIPSSLQTPVITAYPK